MKKLLCLTLVLLLCSALVLPAAADVWFPLDDEVNQNLVDSPENDGGCYALNVFLSNYAETQLLYFDEQSTVEDAFPALLKHFELNPGAYEGSVASFVGADGQTYMKIDGEKFESRMLDLFCLSISAADCPGYEDGYIVVSAENYGAPLTVYASAVSCSIIGHNQYFVTFEIYQTDSGVSDKYAIANCNLPDDRDELIGEGVARFYYYGSTEETEFHPYDFILAEYDQRESYQEKPYANENLPHDESKPTSAVTEANSEETRPSSVETGTSEEAAPQPSTGKVQLESPPEKVPKDNTGLILLVVGIAVLSVAALAIILLVFKKKKP